MFIHAVLFEIEPKEVTKYRRDSLMWARYAKKAKGFVAYRTLKRFDDKNQYASVYEWRSEADHSRFMQKFHDRLVTKSSARVKVLGYYNLEAIDKLGK
jgi:heme-degrading monooxygenase HmoA